jgi:hypothetical protein
MNWVQIYLIVLFSVSLLINANRHGKPRTGNDSFWYGVANLLLFLPLIGRVFGWW